MCEGEQDFMLVETVHKVNSSQPMRHKTWVIASRTLIPVLAD
jgi:hypothetical protein